jgi:hypothetical protein
MNQSTNNNQGERIEPLGPVNAAIERHQNIIALGLLALLACIYSPAVRHIAMSALQLLAWAALVIVVMLAMRMAKGVAA